MNFTNDFCQTVVNSNTHNLLITNDISFTWFPSSYQIFMAIGLVAGFIVIGKVFWMVMYERKKKGCGDIYLKYGKITARKFISGEIFYDDEGDLVYADK